MNLVEPAAPSVAAIATAAQDGSSRRSEPGYGVSGVGEQQTRSRQWRVRCLDVANRERFLTVFVEHGRVVVVGPPGEAALLSPGQLSQLRSALQEAADEAER